MKYVLQHDITVKAGTIFSRAATVSRRIQPHIAYVMPLGDNSCMDVIVPIEEDNIDFNELFKPLT